jgi:hypothetical protein
MNVAAKSIIPNSQKEVASIVASFCEEWIKYASKTNDDDDGRQRRIFCNVVQHVIVSRRWTDIYDPTDTMRCTWYRYTVLRYEIRSNDDDRGLRGNNALFRLQ